MKIFNTVNQTDIEKFRTISDYIFELSPNRLYLTAKYTRMRSEVAYHIYPLHNKTYWKWACIPPSNSWFIYKGYSLYEEYLGGPQDDYRSFYIDKKRYSEIDFYNNPKVIAFNNPSLLENWNVVGGLLDI